MQQISVFLENRSGQLVEITSALSENNINLRASSIAETKDYGLFRIIVDDTAKAAEVLMGQRFLVTKTPVVAALVPDHPGGLNKVLGIIAEAEIDVEYMYSALEHVDGQALMIFRVEEPEELKKVLVAKGIELEEELKA